MFYDLVFLKRQNQGRFTLAWAAATRGIAFVSREFGLKKIRELDIILLCDETMVYLQSTSNNPKKRLSLRLSTYLIQGVIFLFHKQVSLFQDDLADFFTRITVPIQIPSPPRDSDGSQRQFITPPTPVIRGKRKRKAAAKKDFGIGLEELVRLGTEQIRSVEERIETTEIGARALQPTEEIVPSNLNIVEEQPIIKTGVGDDMFGELGIVPMEVPVVVPGKQPSEMGSEKSQLERIEELLISEKEAAGKTLKDLRKERIRTPQKRKRSSSIEESAKVVEVVAMVHRPAEDERGVATVEIPPPQREVPSERIIEQIEEIRPAEESERPEAVQESEKSEMEKRSLKEKEFIARGAVPKRSILGELQADTLPQRIERSSATSSKESDEQRRRKGEVIAKSLRIKFKKPKTILHLDDYDKIFELKEEMSFDIYNENQILDVELRDFIMQTMSRDTIMTKDVGRGVAREAASSSIGSELSRRMSKLTPTTLRPSVLSTPMLPEPHLRISKDFMEPLTSSMVQTTPFRDIIAHPQKKLYDETRIEIEAPMPERLEREKEKVVQPELVVEQFPIEEAMQLTEEQLRLQEKRIQRTAEEFPVEERRPEKPLSPKVFSSSESPEELFKESSKKLFEPSHEEEARRRNLVVKVQEWDHSQGILTIDYLIPLPKNRINAARTFSDLLALAKECYVKLVAEENSIEVKSVEKGRLLQ